MNPVELIRKKRNGENLSPNEIEFLISNYTKGKIPDYQLSAFLMAAFINGMSVDETSALTNAMLYSGTVVDLSSIKLPKVDKHSTGGIGDKTSLIIAPICAAEGVAVPMISGRGLGHTGGTLDKLEAIPGFSTNLDLKTYKNILKTCGAVLIGQTKEIAPADKLIYSLRDVTATVESIPLITASIMSKKLAEGIDGLVLDVKTGSGAFMKKTKDAEALAQSLIRTANAFNKNVIAFITDMNQPLGQYIGNWLEVYESLKVLNGIYVKNLTELSCALAGAMLMLGGKVKNINAGISLAQRSIQSGRALEKFLEICRLQGADISYLEKPEKYPQAKYSFKILSGKNGYFNAVDTYELGMSALMLGAGRMTKEDKIDPKAGIIFYPSLGEKISKGEVVAECFTDKKNIIDDVMNRVKKSLTISAKKISPPPLIKKILGVEF